MKYGAIALMGASLVLFNAYRFAGWLESDDQKGWLVLLSTAAGLACLIGGVVLFRREPKG